MTPRTMPNQPPLRSKLPDVGTTIFTVMSQLAADCGAINLSQGFPSFNPDPELMRLVDHHMRAGVNQYAPMPGVPALRREIAAKVSRLYGRTVDENTEVTVCTGATEGLFSTVQAIVRPGDEVIVFDPAYDSYEPAVILAGGRAVHVPLIERGNEFHIDWQRLGDSINDRTRLVILNFPQNPTGVVLTGEDLDILAGLVRDTEVFLLSDEVYEHIIFDGYRHESLARYPDLASRSIVISSFGKTYHTTGWKVGYCAAPRPLTAEIQRIHQFVTFTVNGAIQMAYAEFVIRDPFCEDLSRFYQAKRDLFLRLLDGSRFRPLPCRGTYFQLLDYSAITDGRDSDVALGLIRDHGVASIPTSAFLSGVAPGPVLRFCFAKRDETLERAAEKLRQV
jgi:methionine aminotransferase